MQHQFTATTSAALALTCRPPDGLQFLQQVLLSGLQVLIEEGEHVPHVFLTVNTVLQNNSKHVLRGLQQQLLASTFCRDA